LGLELLQAVVLGGVAVALGWHPHLSGAPVAVVVLLLGTAAFTSLALLLAGVLRAEAVLAVANLLWVLLLAGGGVLLPVDLLPGPAAGAASLLPSGALGEALRAALATGSTDGRAMLALVVWTAVLGAAAGRFFRWD
ncbi:MAG TPA: ABC transporter permease, partial [Actinotalea sp.]